MGPIDFSPAISPLFSRYFPVIKWTSQLIGPSIDDLDRTYLWSTRFPKLPYLRKLKEYLIQFNEDNALSDMNATDSKYSPITDDKYVALYFSLLKRIIVFSLFMKLLI